MIMRYSYYFNHLSGYCERSTEYLSQITVNLRVNCKILKSLFVVTQNYTVLFLFTETMTIFLSVEVLINSYNLTQNMKF